MRRRARIGMAAGAVALALLVALLALVATSLPGSDDDHCASSAVVGYSAHPVLVELRCR